MTAIVLEGVRRTGETILFFVCLVLGAYPLFADSMPGFLWGVQLDLAGTILLATATASAAILVLAAAFEGHLHRVGAVPPWARLVLGAGAVLMLAPEPIPDPVGLGIVAVGAAAAALTRSRAHGERTRTSAAAEAPSASITVTR